MESVYLELQPKGNRSGAVLLFMVLIIVVIGVLVWFDPAALFSRSGPDLPWNQEYRLFKAGEEVPTPSGEQASITRALLFEAEAKQEDAKRGKISILIRPDGRIEGGWGGEYRPKLQVTWEIMGSQFKGNIDPSKIYCDSDGKDPTKLYFIAKGKFLILETNSENNRVRNVKGHIYVTGWLDTEYNATGEIRITSDKRSFETFSWRAKGLEQKIIFDFFK